MAKPPFSPDWSAYAFKGMGLALMGLALWQLFEKRGWIIPFSFMVVMLSMFVVGFMLWAAGREM